MNIAKQKWIVDIQDIEDDEDKSKLFSALGKLDVIKSNDVYYDYSFGDYLYNGTFEIDETNEYSKYVKTSYEILSKYVPQDILKSGFVFKVWW